MFLSMIVSVYNKEKYLRDAMDSFLRQDVAPEEYEIVCVDDGSDDSSPAILGEYAAKHPNVRVITKENGGLSSARNAGLREARGDYVMFPDPDDFILPDCLAGLREEAERTGADRIRFGQHVLYSDDFTTAEVFFSKVSEYDCVFSDWNVTSSIFRRAVISDNSLSFCEPIRAYGEDTLFMFEFKRVQQTSAEIARTLYFHRLNPDSITVSRNGNERKRIDARVYIAKQFKRAYDAYDEEGDHGPFFTKSYVAYMLVDLMRILMGDVAGLNKAKDRRACLRELKSAGLFPLKTPPEYPKTNSEYIKGKYGRSRLEKTLYCYSTTHPGFFVFAGVYDPLHRMRSRAGRALRAVRSRIRG